MTQSIIQFKLDDGKAHIRVTENLAQRKTRQVPSVSPSVSFAALNFISVIWTNSPNNTSRMRVFSCAFAKSYHWNTRCHSAFFHASISLVNHLNRGHHAQPPPCWELHQKVLLCACTSGVQQLQLLEAAPATWSRGTHHALGAHLLSCSETNWLALPFYFPAGLQR